MDPDDIDQYATPSPSKRLALYQSSLSTSSNSSCSSPDHPYTSSHLSFDDDSGSDCSWPGTTSYSSSLTFSPLTVHSGNSFPDPKSVPFSFVKPKYVAPPSPLAAGSNSASIQVDPRRNSVGATSYTFTPVRDGHEAQSI